ncbi:MAG TPA: hypothetical protein PLO33_07020, partial [Kouleothrix sp.]|nr:hypothetical protein [Kouleothrix sp.]
AASPPPNPTIIQAISRIWYDAALAGRNTVSPAKKYRRSAHHNSILTLYTRLIALYETSTGRRLGALVAARSNAY